MYASGKPVWYLPFALVALAFFLYIFFVLQLNDYASNAIARHPASLTAIFSSDTINALNRDPRLQDALLSLTAAIAETSTNLGDRFRFQNLKRFGMNLTDGITHVRAAEQSRNTRRGLLEDMGSAFGQLLGANTGAGESGGLNFTGGLTGILDGLGGSVVDSLTTPALFLGIGLGMGTSTGLNLTDMGTASAQGTRVASVYNASATGANLIAQNLGSGLAGQISPSFETSNISLGAAAYALATGVGNATAYSFNLTQQEPLTSNESGVEAAAGNFGLGLAKPIVSKIDFQAVIKNVGGTRASMFAQQLPGIAAAAGQGFGEGAKDGLGLAATNKSTLRKRQESTGDPFAGIDIATTVSSFTKGLSQSFLTGSDLTKLNFMGGMNLTGMIDLQSMLRPLAAGAGAGIGMGVAVGLNLKSADAQPTFGGNITGKDEQTASIAEGFVQNMLSNFLMNSTALQQASTFIASSQPQLFKNADGAKAAEGFARGMIEGVTSAMSSVGGLKNLISGQVPPNALENVPVLQPSQFNDSVNGSAVGFARGFTGTGTILAAEVIRNLTRAMQNSTGMQPMQRRNVDAGANEGAVVSFSPLSARQNSVTAPTVPSFPPAIDAQTLQMGVQKAIDTLTCQGIGGIAAVGLGAMSGAKAKAGMMSSAPLDPSVFQSLPDGPITLKSEGNNFQIVIKQAGIEINGLKLVPFAVLTALHVVFAGLAFLTFLPLYLILGVVWRFSVLAGHPVNEAKNRKWRMGFLITFAVLGISGIILGIVGMGNAKHFRAQHGIFGLISLLLLFPATIFSIIRLRTTIPHPSPASFAGIKAPFALAKTPQRIYLISGILTQLVLAIGQFAFIQGFATLRSISLCIIDAVLTSNAVANLVSIFLMVQISATGLIGLRAWLEQHIAKREASNPSTKDRKSSIQTFGFDHKDPPAPLDLTEKPKLVQRKTEELKGFEDNGISSPFNVRKEGEVMSPVDTPRTYNPKIGAYEYELEDKNEFYNVPATYISSAKLTPGRASSELFMQGPKTMDVSTRDLFPPPSEPEWEGRVGSNRRRASSSYSRPFSRGPGGTVRL